MSLGKTLQKSLLAAAASLLLFAGGAGAQTEGGEPPQPQPRQRFDRFESERSDKVTGGRIEQADLVPGERDIRLTLNVPSFRLTLWQNGREVKSYWVGVGRTQYPIYIGAREASAVIWNPDWIPPDSDWVKESRGVRSGEIIKASDPRNPLGKLKIPLGDGYLIHEAKGVSDLGNLVSHGCVRMLRRDLYDLAEKIVVARGLSVSRRRIERAKRDQKMLAVALEEPIPVQISYDTLVVEGGKLHVYPDVYERRTNTAARLRAELESSGLDASALDDRALAAVLKRAARRSVFVVDVESLFAGRALAEGRREPLIPGSAIAPRAARRRPALPAR